MAFLRGLEHGSREGGSASTESPSLSDDLVCNQVTVGFAGVLALDRVNISVNRGEVVGLIGPNGAGKTTLVNAITGFAPVTSGSIHLSGRDITHMQPNQRAQLGLSRTFQHGHLFSGLSVRENVELGALAVGLSQSKAKVLVDELLEKLELVRLAHLPVAQLSHGDQQRVSVARAAAAKPAFLLLDEPAAGLPEGSLDELEWVIREAITDSGAGVLIIDHNVEFVLRMSNRVVVLDYGEVIAEGPADIIRADVNVMSAYLGEAGVPEEVEQTFEKTDQL
ncbi:MAG: ATP-binding cassette domain-containing protein [Actinobacteria bacterium]|jgi:branched-chain amino acid transport system ATP-binding protein|nr:ATP-binding cassette domain-containing protein [Actinomycetota bacterium]MCL6094924.1 ATP-binding cassette domain-containing protein [Actinomycetota bacterium]